jgi:hypothetical protein
MIAKHIASAIRTVGPGIEAVLEALALLGGAALVAYGAWEAYAPAGPIVGGVLLIAGAILRARGNS